MTAKLLKKRRNPRNSGLSKSRLYATGIMSLPYDLQGIVETIGADRTIHLVKMIAADLSAGRRIARKTSKQQASAVLTLQIGDTLARQIERSTFRMEHNASARTRGSKRRAA